MSRTSSPEAWTAALPGLGLLAVTQPTSLLNSLTRSAAPLPPSLGRSQARVKSLARPSGSFFISVSAQISRLVVYTCSFRMRLPWQVVKWRCSVDSDPASRGSSSSLASLLAIRHTISSCFWFAGAGHKREWLEGHSFCIAGRTASGAVVT